MGNKTLFLHIGTPKTGTTAIQVFLRENRRALARKDFFVCTAQDSSDRRNLRFLTAHLGVFGIQELRGWGKLCGDPKKESVFLSKWFESFIRRLSRVKQDQVVLSEEMLWWALCDGDKLNRLLERLKSFFDVKVIVYLRRQDHYIMSIYQQALKACCVDAKSCAEWISDPHNRQVTDYTRYDRCLEKLAGYVGRENILVRLYEPSGFRARPVFDDFMQCVGADGVSGFRIPEDNINPGLNAQGAALALCMNRIQSGPGFMQFISRFQEKDRLFNGHGATYSFLSPVERRSFLENYEEGNRKVAQTFFGRDVLFREPPPQGEGAAPEAEVLPVLLKLVEELSARLEKVERIPLFLRGAVRCARALKSAVSHMRAS
jgi:hypothetical protein